MDFSGPVRQADGMTSFAVIDLETTGLHPGYHHRVIEIAIVGVGPGGIEESWSTLLNPDRDLGLTGLHGVTGHDTRHAPRFADVAGEVLDRLRGRVPVAHNARFDQSFLEAEFSRLGIDIAGTSWVCTMSLADQLCWGRRLVDCCRSCGVSLVAAHTALGDALACAELLIALCDKLPLHAWPATRDDPWGAHPGQAECLERSVARAAPRADSFVGRLVAGLGELVAAPVATQRGGYAVGYLEILDRVLADRRVTSAELEELTAVADMYGLRDSDLEVVHKHYMSQLLAQAWADGVVTLREQADLELVAALLGIAEPLAIEPAVARTGPPAQDDLGGRSVCFTGALTCLQNGNLVTRERAASLASAAGLIVLPRVTKQLDILVVADPETASGKAAKARTYGTTIIAEAAFWPLIGVEVT